MRGRGGILIVAALLVSAPCRAQDAYISGVIGAEMLRTTTFDSGGSYLMDGGGTNFSGGLRVGTVIAPRFGVEFEFYRPAEIESRSQTPIYYAAGMQTVQVVNVGSGSPVLTPSVATVPSLPIIQQRTTIRTTTIGALLFARQSLGSRFELVYLGGLGLSHVVHESAYGGGRVIPLAQGFQPFSNRTIQYGAGPVVGVEGRIGMTEHLRLVTGVRVHTLGQSLVDGWLIRPSVGLAWKF